MSARWIVIGLLSGLACRTVDHTTRTVHQPHPAAPSAEIRLGLEWVDGRGDRVPVRPGQEPEPQPRRMIPTLNAARATWPDSQWPAAILSEPPASLFAAPAEKPRRPSDDRRPAAKAPTPHRDAPERVLYRFLSKVDEGERLEKVFGYGRMRSNESFLSWSDPEMPILVRDREQFGERLTLFGPRMFFRPAEKSLTELDFYRDAKMGLDDVKSRVFAPNSGTNWGTFTARFRNQTPTEMMELGYRLQGMRIGTTAGSLRASCDRWLTPWLRIEIASRVPYNSGEATTLGGGIHCHLSRWLEVHLVAGTQTNRDMLPSLFMLSDPAEPASPGGGIYMSYRF